MTVPAPIVAPSILAADFARLADEVQAVESTADWLHVDVMDNHFVPNLTIGLPVVQSLLAVTALPFDVHLMIDDPRRWAPSYADAGAYNVTFHVEACDNPVSLAKDLRSAGAKAGLAIDRDTPIEPYLDLLPSFDTLLIMTIKAGFGGSGSSPSCSTRSGPPVGTSMPATSSCGSRWTAASRPTPSSRRRRPARTPSSPAPPSTALPTRPRR
ncbi:hypothetical protein GCM10027615_66260 [Plantactinospora veratri]